jgi:hypothetical protein
VTNAEFIRLMFAKLPEGALPWVTAFSSPPAEVERGAWAGWPVRRLGGVPSVGNTYVAVSSFLASGGRYRRRKVNFSAMHMVMFDDIGTKVPERSIALPFTVMVETSPGNCQGWLKLDPPIADRDLAERLVERMVAAGLATDGRDPGMKGVTRYGRLPEGTNNKPRELGPWLHRVVEVREHLTYKADEIAEAYGLDLAPPPARTTRVPRDAPLPDVLGRLHGLGMYQTPLGDGWHAITCPWSHEHSGGVTTGSAYREPAPENNMVGAFKCFHGHCEGRGIGHLFRFLDHVTTMGAKA